MDTTPEESPEERRTRIALERRARRDRIIQNQEFLTDRTSFLRRQFGIATGNIGGAPRGRPGGFLGALFQPARQRLPFLR